MARDKRVFSSIYQNSLALRLTLANVRNDPSVMHDVGQVGLDLAGDHVAGDDAARAPVAGVLDVLDRLHLRHVGRRAGEHLLHQAGPRPNLLGEGGELGVELLVAGNQAESRHVTSV